MRKFVTILRYEFLNIMRSRWLVGYTFLLGGLTLGFSNLSDDPVKVLLSLTTAFCAIAPLVSVLFGCMSWYQAERFTQLLLTQPVNRRTLFCARILALVSSLGLSLVLGFLCVAWLLGIKGPTLVWLFCATFFLSSVFCLIGTLISVYIQDRMWGLGSAVVVWVYSALVHDGLILLVLLNLRDYPMDLWSGILCAANPIGLARVTLLLHFDAPLLLGHSGALIRNLVESGQGFIYAGLIGALWVIGPLALSFRRFGRRDF